jgi:hypothetical protein
LIRWNCWQETIVEDHRTPILTRSAFGLISGVARFARQRSEDCSVPGGRAFDY